MSKLKKLNPSSFSELKKKLIRLVMSELKRITFSSSFESEIELIRLVVSKLKRLDSLKFSELKLRLIKRIMIESVRSSISIRKVVSIYDELFVRKEIQINVITDSM